MLVACVLVPGLLVSSDSMLPRFVELIKGLSHGVPARSTRPFVVGGEPLGLVLPNAAEKLALFDDVYEVTDSEVRLVAGGSSVEARSAAVMRTLEALRDAGSVEMLRGWRSETWPIKRSFYAQPEVLVERAAVPLFGVPAFGCFVNGLVGTDRMWVARRSRAKPTYPGKLDLIAAGGLAHGELPSQNVAKECEEEACIPPALARQARSAGLVSYVSLDETGWGIKRDTLFVYDLRLPDGFRPVPGDGEVESFELLHVRDVLRSIADSPDEWKPNVALVIIDMCVRLGHISPDRKGYLELVHSLRTFGGR